MSQKNPDDFSLSSDQVCEVAGKEVPIIRSSDYGKYNTIDELIGPQQCAILLYENSRTPNSIYGHWCAVYKNDDDGEIYYFDSYGYDPTKTWKRVPEQYRLNYKLTHDYLSQLLADSNYDKIIYNHFKLQGPESETCGRYVGFILRLMCSEFQFKELLDDLKNEYGFSDQKFYDDTIIEATNKYLK